jgi:hypothetical protein
VRGQRQIFGLKSTSARRGWDEDEDEDEDENEDEDEDGKGRRTEGEAS